MIFRRFTRNDAGSVSVEMSFLVLIMTLATGGAVEAGYAYTQHSTAQQAARHGVRLAALTSPVSSSISGSTGAYDVSCSGDTERCSSGAYRADAMQRIVQGPDSDGRCAATSGQRRGMCDLMETLSVESVSVRYVGQVTSAGDLSSPPLISVTISERPLRTALLGGMLPGKFRTLPAVTATLMGEDLDG